VRFGPGYHFDYEAFGYCVLCGDGVDSLDIASGIDGVGFWWSGYLVFNCTEARVGRVGERGDGTFWAWQGLNDFCGHGHFENSLYGLDIQGGFKALLSYWLGGAGMRRV